MKKSLTKKLRNKIMKKALMKSIRKKKKINKLKIAKEAEDLQEFPRYPKDFQLKCQQ